MNTFNRFIVTPFCLLVLSIQALAIDFTQATKDTNYIISDTQDTIRVTFDGYALSYLDISDTVYFDENNNILITSVLDQTGVDAAVISTMKFENFEYTTATHKVWDLIIDYWTLKKMREHGGKRFTLQTYNGGAVAGASINGALSDDMPQRTLNLCWEDCGVLAITSTNTLSINEGVGNTTHTLIASDTAATFSIIENTSGFFSLSGTNNATLTFNGTTTDYEVTKSYALKIKATTGNGNAENAEQIITVNLVDVNDNAPTEISLTGDIYLYTGIIEDNKRKVYDKASSGTVATLTTADVDTNNTFTYTLIDNEKNTFKISEDGTKLELNGVDVDYETNIDKSLSFSIKVNDGNHEFIQSFKLEIKDMDDNSPSNILINTTDIANNTSAGMQVAYFSAVDVDTVGTHIFTLYDLNDNDGADADNNKFTLSTDGKLSIKETVNFATQAQYKLSISVEDGIGRVTRNFTLNVIKGLAITSPAIATVIENTDKVITLTSNKSNTTFAITGGTDQTKFTLNGTQLTFTATDFEARADDNTYEVEITASKTGETNAAQTLIVTVTDLNDETPSNIDFVGSSNITENTATGAELGTLSTTDADTGDTFTYTLENNSAAYFAIDGNKLKLAKTVDYESTKTLNITVKVTDGNNHSLSKTFDFAIIDANDIAPSNIQLSTTIIADNTTTGTTIATITATDTDTTGETIVYTLGGTDANSFSINGSQLKMAQNVVFATKSNYSISITASDGVNTSVAANFTLSVKQDFAITSSATATAIENTDKTINLVANRIGTSFAITDGADKAKFTLNGTTLTFAATDFEARADNTYEVEITASKIGENDTTQTLIVTVTDLNDETPSNIDFAGSSNITENTATGAELGTLSTTDADTGDTFTYTLENNSAAYFAIDGNKLKLAKTVDYESTKTLNITVKVTDGNNHSFSKTFDFAITDANDIAPSNIQLSTITIADSTTTGTTIAIITATDTDTTGETMVYTLGGTDANSFSINGSQLKMAQNVVFATKSNYSISITASDGVNTSVAMNFTLSVNQDFAITSSATATATEETDKIINLTANRIGATFNITGGADKAKFTLNGATLTFVATDFEARADDNTYEVEITASKTGEDNAIQTIIVTLNNIFENTIAINDQALSVDENASIDDNIGTLVTTGTVTAFTISTGNDDGFFKINNTGRIQVARTDLDYETKQSYTLTVKIEGDDAKDETAQITITINNLLENTLAIADQTRSVEESAITDTNIGAPLITTGTITTFSITAGNDKNFFKIDNIGQIQVAKTGLDYETKQSYTLTVKIEDADAEDKTAQINIEITDVDDIAPTNIVLTHNNITLNAPIGTIIGTLSATDIDTKDLTYSVVNNTNFEITGNQLKVKTTPSTIATLNLNITASDGTNTSTPQAFTIAVIDNNTPIIKQFIVTQDGNNGRLISKNGGDVTVQAVVSASSYTWGSSSLTNKNSGNSTTFVFDPTNINSGTHAIKLKVEANSNYSERTLQLKLITESITSNDSDGDGIPNDKDTSNANNKIQAGEGKTIASSTNTRLLLGILATESARLTLAQNNQLSNKSSDTLTIGDIYDYVIEGLSTTGATTEVIIDLTTPIPKNSELYKYSSIHGWSAFVVDNNNTIKSKKTCTDISTWQTGLITDTTCLKLTIKDGGENDTDGTQVNNRGQDNGVIKSTISITTPASNDSGNGNDDSNSGGGSSGGGCAYNPNAPTRFDISFILLMVLSTYYLIRRRRRFSH
ncbi:hypothetical protein THERMOT_893 [Bathymodiolus thermophilus thioautotrophic gill symbiont]|nr:cadherin repeat domain-containing protein [Bathymodiolus thermophilus thioautotrophic gill symbiont]CAB5498593.1 hypothetical protein THERMOT_893 [Bathymodiolus thermophilus thioautotrophic gill symbiont]